MKRGMFQIVVLFCVAGFLLFVGLFHETFNSAEATVVNRDCSRRILVTGAAGFIGFHLSKTLSSDANCSVVGLDNMNGYYSIDLKLARVKNLKESSGVHVVVGDVCNPPLLEKLLRMNDITHVVHLAAQAGTRYSVMNPLSYVRNNVECFVVLLEAMISATRIPRLIFASSSSVYGRNEKTPFAESDRVDKPASIYAATKRADELIARVYSEMYGIPIVGLRFFTVYGPWGRPDMAYFSFSDKISHAQPIEVFNFGKNKRDMTYVSDVVSGIISVIHKDDLESFSLYNIGNSDVVSMERLISLLETHLAQKAAIIYVKASAGDVLETFADLNLSLSKFNFIPKISVEQGIAMFMKWFTGPEYRSCFSFVPSARKR